MSWIAALNLQQRQWNEKALEATTGFLALEDCVMGSLYCYWQGLVEIYPRISHQVWFVSNIPGKTQSIFSQ